ncbi:MAG: phosphogluconate dehydrogenase (NAD(+)-dependent, decarboxylating) [Acidimicrobiia bacterium]
MQLGMVGLGRMGANLVRRATNAGIACVGYDPNPPSVDALASEGIAATSDLVDFIGRLDAPRVVWCMVPAGAVDSVVDSIAPQMQAGDILIDGGNSRWTDDLVRADRLRAGGVHMLDVGTSGGVFGLERGFCLMIGGDAAAAATCAPLFDALAPGEASVPPTPSRGAGTGTAARGWLHCGSNGAGHFVKMVHNGIEYGVMAAIAEGLAVLHHADRGAGAARDLDAETTPLAHPEWYRYDIDVAEVAEVWRRGSVISSWLMDLTADALAKSPELSEFSGRVSDSGEGRWTVEAAVDLGVPVPTIAGALWDRFASRGEADFGHQVLSALRSEFGGHAEKSAGHSGDASPS